MLAIYFMIIIIVKLIARTMQQCNIYSYHYYNLSPSTATEDHLPIANSFVVLMETLR